MKKILGLTATYPIHPRLKKICNTIQNTNDKVVFLSFNLENKNSLEKNVEIFNYRNNNKFFKYLKVLYKLYNFIKKGEIDIYVCRGHITFIILSFITIFMKKKEIYYDVPDLIEERKYFNILEKYFLLKCNKIFLASRFFYKYYEKCSDKVIILENYPSKKTYKLDFKTKFYYSSENKILSFIGYIRYFDVLKNLVNSIKNKKIDLLFFGSGTDESKLKEYCKENSIDNVHFFGEYNYLDLYKFYNVSDFIWAAYDYRIDNVKYAISNKFYEDILYEKVGIYSKFTELGDFIEKNNIGLTVDFLNKEEMESLMNSLINNDFTDIKRNIKEYKKNNILFWEEQIEELNKLR